MHRPEQGHPGPAPRAEMMGVGEATRVRLPGSMPGSCRCNAYFVLGLAEHI